MIEELVPFRNNPRRTSTRRIPRKMIKSIHSKGRHKTSGRTERERGTERRRRKNGTRTIQ
jgi:hypothetical protein